MRKLTHAALIAIGSVTGTMMFAGGIVTGCGSSSSGGGTTEDSGADSTAPTADSGVDAGHDSSLASFDSGTVTADTGTGDTGTVTGDTGTGDTGTGTGDASDSGEVTGEGGSEAGDGGAEAEAGCTTLMELTDGGGVLVTGFDTATTAGWTTGIDEASDAAVNGTVSYSATVGRTCPGALAMTVPFSQYVEQNVEVNYNYQNNVQNFPFWTGFTKLHYWVMVGFEGAEGGAIDSEAGAPFFLSLGGNSNYAQWNTYGSGNDTTAVGDMHFFTGPSFLTATGPVWQEVVLVLDDPNVAADAGPVPTGAGCLTGNACKMASQLLIPAVMPEGGLAEPTTTVLYVDDIWLE